MELKKGYKQSEIGIIPEDWYLISYGEIFDFLPTATYSRSKLDQNGYSDYVHYGDIHTKWNHFLDFNETESELQKISEDKSVGYSTLKDGDLIVADASEDYEGIGKSVEVKNIGSKIVISGLHTYLLRSKVDYIANGFKGYIHSNTLVKKQFDRLATGLKVYGITKTNLKKILIPIPPTNDEQSAIADALSDIDNWIKSLTSLINKKKDIKQGTMQKLLNPYENGQLKKGWIVKKLGDLAEMESGGTPLSSISAYYNGSFPWVAISDMTKGGKVINTTDRSLTALGLANSAAKMFPTGTVLYAMYASLGECSIAGVSVCTSQAILGIRTTDDLDTDFLYYYLSSKKSIVKKIGQQGTQSNLNKGMVQNFILKLPSDVDEQSDIANILTDIDAEIAALKVKLTKAKQIKQGMVQNLLTGKIRLI